MDDQITTPDEAIAEIGRVRRRIRKTLADGSWRYLSVWSVVFLGAWISSYFPVAPYYWLIGLPLGYVGMWLLYRGGEPAAGRRDAPYWITGIGIAVANSMAGIFLPDEATVVVVWVVIGIGFGIMAWLDRQPAASGLFLGLAIASASLGIMVDDRFALYSALALAYALASGGCALTLWSWARRQGSV